MICKVYASLVYSLKIVNHLYFIVLFTIMVNSQRRYHSSLPHCYLIVIACNLQLFSSLYVVFGFCKCDLQSFYLVLSAFSFRVQRKAPHVYFTSHRTLLLFRMWFNPQRKVFTSHAILRFQQFWHICKSPLNFRCLPPYRAPCTAVTNDRLQEFCFCRSLQLDCIITHIACKCNTQYT